MDLLEPGANFAGKFEVLRKLSQGGMGAVYVVRQAFIGKERALKVMLPTLVSDERSRERFFLEARIGGKIPSPHIVEVIEAGIDEDSGSPWICMELLKGETLKDAIQRRGAFPLSEGWRLLEELGTTLGLAHDKGILHLDLKPGNIFLMTRREKPTMVKILDFGISKMMDGDKSVVTVTTEMGTPAWMAPEQAERGSKLRPSVDVWPFGLIAFFILGGRYYWRTLNDPKTPRYALLKETLFSPIVPPSERLSQLGGARSLPPGFDDWFMRCVERDPEKRFRDCAEATVALKRALLPGRMSGPAIPRVDLDKTLDTPDSGVAEAIKAAIPAEIRDRPPAPPKRALPRRALPKKALPAEEPSAEAPPEPAPLDGVGESPEAEGEAPPPAGAAVDGDKEGSAAPAPALPKLPSLPPLAPPVLDPRAAELEASGKAGEDAEPRGLYIALATVAGLLVLVLLGFGAVLLVTFFGSPPSREPISQGASAPEVSPPAPPVPSPRTPDAGTEESPEPSTDAGRGEGAEEEEGPTQLAQACMESRDYSCVMRTIRDVPIGDRDAEQLAMLIEAYQSSGHEDRAIDDMRQFVQRFPEDPRSASYRRTLAHSTSSHGASSHGASSHGMSDHGSGGRRSGGRNQRCNPSDSRCIVQTLRGHARTPDELASLIRAYQRLGDTPRMVAEMRRYVQRYPSNSRSGSYRQILARY